MRFSKMVKGRFLYRNNLFRARIALGGREYWAHVPNTGKLEKLLVRDRPIYLIPTPDHTRKTSYSISLVDLGDTLVSIDTRLPNHLFKEYLRNEQPEIFSGYEIQSEVAYENHRFDFRLNKGEDILWIETKSVTFTEDDMAKFPDAVSNRAQNHLRKLIELSIPRETAIFLNNNFEFNNIDNKQALTNQLREVRETLPYWYKVQLSAI